ncbi:MAG TPA: hypothetical protein PLO78_08805 [Candidatus Omnitrophota bacterium]|nr:hypothetical protein [Candidatus Omnitrophota bacterium]
MGEIVEKIGAIPLSFWEYLTGQSIGNTSAMVSGCDGYGQYVSQIADHGTDCIYETRSYFYASGKLKRIAAIIHEGYGESLIRSEEWGENGAGRIITHYSDIGEWLWVKVINQKTGAEKVVVNRDSFSFFSVPEDLVHSLENDEFRSARLLEIKWEGVREAILEILGAAKVVPGLPMQTIDQIGPNRLLRIEWRDMWGAPRMDSWCFLELHCTTTEKVSYLRVPPVFNDIMSAVAWTFRMQKEDYFPDQET